MLSLAVAAAILVLGLTPGARAATMFYIRGGGYGHGIGMSQYGAYGYALHHKGYRWILQHYYSGTTIGTTNANQTVRVLLSTRANSFSGATRAGARRLDPNLTYTVRPNADGTLTLIPNGPPPPAPKKKKGKHAKPPPLVFAAPLLVTGRGPLTLGGVGSYRDALEFRPSGANSIETVNVVRLEDYVRGVIAWEMPSSWPAQALAAQAVAARTYAITTDVSRGDYGLYDDTRSQMYGGVAAETSATDAAVAATRGQVVTYKGVPVVTYFFSSSGGHTENVENVWPGATPEPWLRGVPDPYDGAGGDPYHRWAYQLSLAAAAHKLAGLVKGSLIGIEVIRHGASPRIITAEVVGTKGTTRVTGIKLQQTFGLQTTYAAFTTITTLPGRGPIPVPHAPSTPTSGGAPQSQAVIALLPLVVRLAGSVIGLHGTVFPATARTPLTIERRTAHGWKTVLKTRIGAADSYATALPGRGTYRIVFRGIDGPAVTIG